MHRLACPIEQPAFLLPHSGHMVLIDRVTEHRADFVSVEAHIGERHILLHNGVLPATMGMEIMAQAIGAFAGIQAISAGEEVKLGFLLGTRKLNLFADSIPVGTTLAATAHLSTQDPSGMGVFDCELRWIAAPDGVRDTLAQAALNVYSPKEARTV